MLYVVADSGPYGDVYQVNPTNGAVIYLVRLNIPGNGEWEGLDYFQSFFIAAEGGTGTVNFYDFFSANRRIAGSVRDNHNSPIIGVAVMASATINGTNQIVKADTNTNGNYSLSVPLGNWNVAVNCSNGTNSLANLGNYLCPEAQSIAVTNGDVACNFIVTNCTIFISAPAAFPIGEVGIAYNQSLQAYSCNPVFTWTVAGGSLPSGLSLSANGIVSGTPSSSGIFNFIVQVSDGNNSTTNRMFSIGISNAVQISTRSLPDCDICSVQLAASNGVPPYLWSLGPGSDILPPKLSLASDGLLGGIAATNGTFTFKVRVTDSIGAVANQHLTINLTEPFYTSFNGSQLFVVWPGWATNYVLQTTYDLTSTNWMTVTGAMPGATFIVTNAAPRQFFRLH
jgi:hypothetical protein